MQRSYLVKAPVNFADFGFFVKVGDILTHDTSNANKLTVWRNGEAVQDRRSRRPWDLQRSSKQDS